MPLTLVPLPGNEDMARRLADAIPSNVIEPEIRRFPDAETYIRLDADLTGREVAIVCTLDRPDSKAVPLAFSARLARELGAKRVGLIAPYLAYMRQDRQFHPGEALSSRYFAELVASYFDWLVTVDPHLHRRHSLAEIYSIPARAVTAAPLLSAYVRAHVSNPTLIGPDAESEQWVAAVAAGAGAPHLILEKQRRGDRDVRVSVPDAEALRGRTPVLVDDIIATGHTMIETIKHLRESGLSAPVCLGIHAVFADGALAELRAAGAARIVTTNSIAHETNEIDVSSIIAAAVSASIPIK